MKEQRKRADPNRKTVNTPGIGEFISPCSFWSPLRTVEPHAWVEHIPFAYWLVNALRPNRLVELGVHSGNSYFAFCQAVQALNLKCACYAVDTWLGDEHASLYGENIFEEFRDYHSERYSSFSSPIRATFDDACVHFEHASIDLIHFDGLHTYDAVRHDFEKWLPKITARGVALFHDTNVLDRNFGVHLLWSQLKQNYPHFEFYHGHGLGVLGVGHLLAPQVRRLFDASRCANVAQDICLAYARLGSHVLAACTLRSRDHELQKAKSQVAEREEEARRSEECLKASITELDQVKTDLTAQITEQELQAGQLSERVQRLDQINSELNAEAGRLSDRLQRLDQTNSELTAQARQLSERVQSLDQTNSELITRIVAYEGEITRLNERSGALITELDEAKSLVASLKVDARLSRARAELAEEQVKAAFKALLAAKQRTEPSEGKGRLSPEAPNTGISNRDSTGEASQLRERALEIESSTCWRLTWPLRHILEKRPRSRIAARRGAALLLSSAHNEVDITARLRVRLADPHNPEIRLLFYRLVSLETSTSWRLSEPIRRLLTRNPTVHRLLRGIVRSVLRTPTHRSGIEEPAIVAIDEADPAGVAIDLYERPPARPSGGRFSIIVCIHNALDDVRQCLQAVLEHSRDPYELILVDDGSAPDARKFLRSFSEHHQSTLLSHNHALGYTLSANEGMRVATGSYIVLLNSDTVVTAGWLEAIETVFDSYPRTGIVGPLSNTASWQSVPDLADGDDWAANRLPAGLAVVDIGRLVSSRQPAHYRLPFVNGFCLALRRQMLAEIGLFDDVFFRRGYGEENDLCIRARKSRWELRIADNCYVWHSQSKSYSHERRKVLAAEASATLALKHDELRDIAVPAEFCRNSQAMLGVREWVRNGIKREQLIDEQSRAFAGARIAFVLPIAGEGGGANVVFQEAIALKKFGIDVTFINLNKNREGVWFSYPRYAQDFVFFDRETEIAPWLMKRRFDAVIATAFESNFWLPMQREFSSRTRSCYYVQDYEAHFDELDQMLQSRAIQSYRRDLEQVLVTKTMWNRDIVAAETGRMCEVVGPSVDVDIFAPTDRDLVPHDDFRICAMVRPSSARRQPELTYQLLARLTARFGSRVKCYTFGCDESEIASYRGRYGGPIHHFGRLDRLQMRNFLRAMDVFVDLSKWQAMGLTLLEAMACGLLVLGPTTGGVSEFIRDGENGLLIDTTTAEPAFDAFERILKVKSEIMASRRNAVVTAQALYPEIAAAQLAQIALSARVEHSLRRERRRDVGLAVVNGATNEADLD